MHRSIYLLLIVLRLLPRGLERSRINGDHVGVFPFCHELRQWTSLRVDLLFYLRLGQFLPVAAFEVPIG